MTFVDLHMTSTKQQVCCCRERLVAMEIHWIAVVVSLSSKCQVGEGQNFHSGALGKR
jgi:hypothetical protein